MNDHAEEGQRRHRRLRAKEHRFGFFRYAVLFLLLAALLVTGFYLIKNNRTITSRTVEFGLRNIGELATQAGYFTNVQTISDSRELFGIIIPFTQKRYVYSYDGVVKAGVNFEQVGVTSDPESKTVTVTIPHAKILSIEVDENSLQVYDESKNIFNTLKIQDHNQAMQAMKAEITEKATTNGILKNAEANAEVLITGFLSGSFPADEYRIEFNWVEEIPSEE